MNIRTYINILEARAKEYGDKIKVVSVNDDFSGFNNLDAYETLAELVGIKPNEPTQDEEQINADYLPADSLEFTAIFVP